MCISIEDKIKSSNLYPDFVFWKRQKQAVNQILYFSLFCVGFSLDFHSSCDCVAHVVTSWLTCFGDQLTGCCMGCRNKGSSMALNRLQLMFDMKVEISHWDLLEMFYLILQFSYFHTFSILLIYLINFLHLVWTH